MRRSHQLAVVMFARGMELWQYQSPHVVAVLETWLLTVYLRANSNTQTHVDQQ